MDCRRRHLRRVFAPTLAPLLGLSLAGCPKDDGGVHGQEGGSSTATPADTSAGVSSGFVAECDPGEIRCKDATALERCAPTGKEWLPDPCPSKTVCTPCDNDNCTQDQCLGPCDSEDELPSSAGCSFIANRQILREQKFFDSLVVANPNSAEIATVQLWQVPEGSNQEVEVGEAVMLAPLEVHVYELDTNFVLSESSAYRTGGNYRVSSDEPIIAYHHAPGQLSNGNDSSMLLPESAMRQEYVVMSYAPGRNQDGQPSYFEVVALQDFTTLEWFPPVDTSGNGLPVPFVAKGESGLLKMNRYDTVRIAASGNNEENQDLRDVSGTIVKADKPFWITSGTKCARVPVRDPELYPKGHCDPLQELPIPLEYWGTQYVAPASPDRHDEEFLPDGMMPDGEIGHERHHWRVFAGADDVTITTDPPQPGTPITLAKRGDFAEFSVANNTSFVFQGDKVFMPVQYLQSQRWDSDIDGSGVGMAEPASEYTVVGDPSMYQMVPVEQFLTRYVFVPAVGFPINYVQVIKKAGAAGVRVDGDLISTYTPITGEWQVADYVIDEIRPGEEVSAHVIESDEPFGIIQVGYSPNAPDDDCLRDDVTDATPPPPYRCLSSYAYPGGMKSEPIFIP